VFCAPFPTFAVGSFNVHGSPSIGPVDDWRVMSLFDRQPLEDWIVPDAVYPATSG
jgi:hypothetical protein